jgi:Mg2+-importing ATPase
VLTGPRTAFGQVASAIGEQRVLTSFDKGITRFTWLMLIFIVVMAPLVFMINGVTKGNWLEALLFAVAVAVGLTLEMLPMIVTVNLAKGAMAMSRGKVIVKRLNAIQNFGAMNVLCTDKTGTLTQDRIILKRHLDIRGGDSARVLEYAYLNSFYQTGLKNLLDVAVLKHVELDAGLKVQAQFQKIDEMPFDFERRRMSVVLGRNDGVHILICKGAVEEVFAACTHYAIDDETGPLDKSKLAFAMETTRQTQRGRISGRRSRLQRNAANPGGVSRRRRGRPHLARLYRVSRPAEGDGSRSDCHAEGQRRAGEDPDRGQRRRYP